VLHQAVLRCLHGYFTDQPLERMMRIHERIKHGRHPNATTLAREFEVTLPIGYTDGEGSTHRRVVLRKMTGREEAILADRKYARNGGKLRFCYEAGPCGYGIQRQLSAQVATSTQPQRD
jgi:hypothetical protein